MAAVGSSVINKSTKKIAPKAAVRRRPVEVSASPQTSARASVERQALPPTPPATLTQPSPAPVSVTQAIALEDTAASQAPTPVAQTAGQSQISSQHGGQENNVPVASTDTRQPPSAQEHATDVSATDTVPVPTGTSIPERTPPVIPSPEKDQPMEDEEPERAAKDVGRSQTPGSAGEKRTAPEVDRASKRPRKEPPLDGRSTPNAVAQAEDGHQSQALPTPENTAEQPPLTTPNVEEATRPGKTRGKKTREKTTKRATKSTGTAQKAKATKPAKPAKQTTTQKTRSQKRKSRQPTPEDAEDAVIAPSEVKMADLCKDTRRGKKSERERELAKLEKANAARKRLAQQAEEQEAQEGRGEPSTTATPAAATPAATVPPKAQPRARARAVPALRMVNGKMVVDDQSLQIDRHANAADDDDDIEEVEENDLTRKVNSGTWMKRERKENWNEDSTDRFYQGLRMFGTDFMIISKLFPGRTRRQIKLKFTKEERLDPQRIRDALVGPKEPMDLSLLSRHTNVEYGDPKEFERELEREAQEHAEEQKRQEEQAQEVLRQKRAKNAAAIAAASGNTAETSGTAGTDGQDAGNQAAAGGKTARGKKAAASKQTKTTKSKKKKNAKPVGGEEAEVIGTIDGR